MTETTDPATELATVFKELAHFEHKGTCRDALAARFGCAPDDGVFFSVLSALISRCDRLCEMVVAEPDLDECRDQVLVAIKTVRRVLGTDSLPGGWQNQRDQFLKPQHLTAINMTYLAVRRSHPLRRLSAEERTRLIEQIENVLADARQEQSMAARIIENAFLGLKAIVERLTFFGHDALIEKLLLLYAEVQAADAKKASKTGGACSSGFVQNCKKVIGLAVFLLIASNEVLSAVEDHTYRAQTLLEYLHTELPSPEMKYLPAPEPEASKDEAET